MKDDGLEPKAVVFSHLRAPGKGNEGCFRVFREAEVAEVKHHTLEVTGKAVVAGDGVVQAFGKVFVKGLLLFFRELQEILLLH